jgi:feruloyl esterase
MKVSSFLWSLGAVALAQGTTLSARAEDCANIVLPDFEEFDVVATLNVVVRNYQNITGFDFCNFTVAVTHGDGDYVWVGVWLPLSNWNKQVMVTGGGSLLTGFESYMPAPTRLGYASAWTDGGIGLNNTNLDQLNPAWLITSKGVPNAVLLNNYATRATHVLAVVLKAAATAFYGTTPLYAYYSGCSTGGRMGYMNAEHNPEDFDGILAHAPGLSMPRLTTSLYWPSTVMQNIVAPPKCVFDAYQQELVRQCDAQDGVVDGLASDPLNCIYDLQTLVGTKLSNCTNITGQFEITAQHATVISKILQGPRTEENDFLWYGLAPGTSFAPLVSTSTINGTTVSTPERLVKGWITHTIMRDANFNLNMTFSQSDQVYFRSIALLEPLLGGEYPDLSAFRRNGGKLLSYHGLADNIVAANGTLRYRELLSAKMGGEKALDSFYKLYLAPGLSHCSGGVGPMPNDPLTPLVEWVEKGITPTTLYANITTASGVNITRNLCAYPQKLKYRGSGDTNKAESFTCA